MRKTTLNSEDQVSTWSHLTRLIFLVRLFPPLVVRNFLKSENGIKNPKTPKLTKNQTQKLSLSTMRHLRQRSINQRGNRKGIRVLCLYSEWGTAGFLDILGPNNSICCKPTLPSVLWDTSREIAIMGALGTSLSLGDGAQDVDPVTMKSQEISSPLSKIIDSFFLCLLWYHLPSCWEKTGMESCKYQNLKIKKLGLKLSFTGLWV